MCRDENTLSGRHGGPQMSHLDTPHFDNKNIVSTNTTVVNKLSETFLVKKVLFSQ